MFNVFGLFMPPNNNFNPLSFFDPENNKFRLRAIIAKAVSLHLQES